MKINRYNEYASYDGEYPLSESENVCIITFLQLWTPHLLFNIHSGIRNVLLPWQCTLDHVSPYYTEMVRIANSVSSEYHVGSGAHMLYSAVGTLTDYAHRCLGVPLTYTFEIYNDNNLTTVPSESLSSKECIQLFNPSTAISYITVIEYWLWVILEFAKEATLKKSMFTIDKNLELCSKKI